MHVQARDCQLISISVFISRQSWHHVRAVVRHTAERGLTPPLPAAQCPGVTCWRWHGQTTASDRLRGFMQTFRLACTCWRVLSLTRFSHTARPVPTTTLRVQSRPVISGVPPAACCHRAHPFGLPPLLPGPLATTCLLLASKTLSFQTSSK